MSDYLPPEDSPSPAAPTVPHSREAEEAVVGAVLINPEAYYDVAQFLTGDDFYIHRLRWIWESFTRLHEGRVPIDLLTVADELEKVGQLNEVGGPAFLTSLINTVPTSLNAEAYGKIVEGHSVRRKMIAAANKIASIAYDTETNVDEVMGESEKAVFNVSEKRMKHDLQPIRSVLSDYYDRIDDLAKRPEEIHGVPTGFIDLDKMLTGLQPSDLLIIAGRPGQGKCLAADSELVLEDGSISTIEDIYRKKSARLLTLEENYKLSFTSPSGFLDDGFKPTYKVTTALGRSVETTITHPFLTLQGWQPLSALTVGDRIAVPRSIPVFGNVEMRECDVKLLAYLMGDGCLVHTSPEFIVGKLALKDDFEAAVQAFGGVRANYMEPANRTPYFSVTNIEGKRGRGVTNPLTEWLRSIGVYGLDSHHKFLPACVFTLPKHQLALFLNRLFATDGWVSATSSEIGYASVSEKMIRQLHHLLLRFGIIAGIRHRIINSPTPGKTAWSLDITDGPSLLEFVQKIGVFGQEEKLERFRQRFLESKFNTNNDTIPMEVWESVREFKGDETWASLARRAGIQPASRKINMHVGKRAPSRPRLLQLAEALENPTLTDLATSDIYWDKIISIEPMGENQVYDLTIPDTHNFVANDVCVHNTGFLLSIAKNAGLTHKKHVAIFSLEMSNEQVVQRLIAQETGIDSQRLRTGKLTQEEWPLFTHAIEVFSDTKIFLDDTPAITPLALRTKCRRLHMEFGIDLVIIDYLQLMSGDTRNDNRVQEVSFISRSLKVLARELNVPVLAAAQLSRAVEQRTDKRPVLSDLRESGSLEQDADIVMFIYRPDQYEKDTAKQNIAEIIISKHRNGPVGSVELIFRSALAKFENAATKHVDFNG
ncbi:MAG: replicative DNA helicase [Chloroflexi bacterium]|nr:replicative DNA helicase [Chloroflexota bacterium]